MLKDSYHFVPKANLLLIKGETSFQEVYKQLHQAGQGGFLLVEEGVPRAYVKAYDLADVVVHRTVKEAKRMSSGSPDELNQMLRSRMEMISQTPIKQIISDVSSMFVPVDETWIDVYTAEGPLQDQDHRVFDVREAGESIGWYLNHEGVRDTTTEKPIFVCENGHENPDTDHGTCYSCSASFTDTDKKLSVLAG